MSNDLKHLAIHTMTNKPWSLAQCVDGYASAGIGGISVWRNVIEPIGIAEADRDRLSIRFGAITVAREGARAPDYSEDAASAYMKGSELTLGVDLGLGQGEATVWTCDLTHGYIDINADYRS